MLIAVFFVTSGLHAAGLVAAGLLSVVISPALALVLLRREQPDGCSQLSPRTVEWHLTKAFGKLGISSRKQLRSALSDVGAAVVSY